MGKLAQKLMNWELSFIGDSYIYGGSGSEQIYSIAEAPDKTLVLVGTQTTVGGSNKPFVAKINKDRTDDVWAYSYSASSSTAFADVAIDSKGNIFAGGGYRLQTNGLRVLMKLDSDGNVLWAKHYGSAQYSCISGVALDADENVVVSIYDTANYHHYIKISNETGNIIWYKRMTVTSWSYHQNILKNIGIGFAPNISSHATSTSTSSPKSVGVFAYLSTGGDITYYTHTPYTGDYYIYSSIVESGDYYFMGGQFLGKFNKISNSYTYSSKLYDSIGTQIYIDLIWNIGDYIMCWGRNSTNNKFKAILIDLDCNVVYSKTLNGLSYPTSLYGFGWGRSMIVDNNNVCRVVITTNTNSNADASLFEFDALTGPSGEYNGNEWQDEIITNTPVSISVNVSTPTMTNISITPVNLSVVKTDCTSQMGFK